MVHQHKKCLLLNVDYTPLSIITWKRAMVWSIKYANMPNYGIEVIDFYKDDFIKGTANKNYPIPCVAKTKKFFKRNNNRVVFSKKNIFLRDNYTCQYCNTKFDNKYLTYDHVVPRSKWDHNHGSPTIWTNIVTACVDCNRKKGNKTPQQANMTLHNLPIEPNKITKYLPVSHHLRTIKYEIPHEWYIYLPESYL
jgi:hypothetical protein